MFSKTTGFRHSESIETSKPVFADLAKRNGWFLYETEDGGVFNTAQLAQFSAVIFNNSTGQVLSADQKSTFETYIKNGGSFVGTHGTGDFSHHWEWYENNLVGGQFSHHPIVPPVQKATLTLQPVADSILGSQLAQQFSHTDEWYVFFENPSKKGFNIIYNIDGESINTSGNMLWMKDKDFGMGKDHPVAWYKMVEKGKTFYTSVGHDKNAWENKDFLKLMENALKWAISK